MARQTGLALVLLLAVVGVCHGLDLTTFITDPTYKLFLAKAMATANCLNDPAVTSHAFDLDKCPSLLAALNSLNAGAIDVTADCEVACAATVASLSSACINELSTAFESDPEPIGVTGSEFLASCRAGGTASAPSLAPNPIGRRLARF